MKINDIKHNHSLTDLLKVGIFSILMCAPLIAIGSTCAYAIVNKNAYQSYSGNTLKTNNYINDKDKLIFDEIYTFTSEQATSVGMLGGYTDFIQFEIQDVIYNDTNIDLTQFNAIGFYCSENTTIVYYYLNNTSTTFNMNNNFNSNMHVQFTFKYKYNNLPTTSNVLEKTNNFYQVTLASNGYIDNAFYYATEKMTQSDLFNWTQNTAVYTGVQAMCTQLDIETNVIPILIVYWFILTIIYVIIDIVLKCFTTLTHMISKEAH